MNQGLIARASIPSGIPPDGTRQPRQRRCRFLDFSPVMHMQTHTALTVVQAISIDWAYMMFFNFELSENCTSWFQRTRAALRSHCRRTTANWSYRPTADYREHDEILNSRPERSCARCLSPRVVTDSTSTSVCYFNLRYEGLPKQKDWFIPLASDSFIAVNFLTNSKPAVWHSP